MTELQARYGPQAGSPAIDDAEYYLAYHRDEAMGCAALQPVTPGVMELKRMYVPEHFRGRGFARALLSALEGRVLGRGIGRLRLQTGTHQPEAIALYESCGYVRVDAWGKYASDPNAVCYEKNLV